MFVKICGLTTEAAVAVAVASGADAVGFVLTESPRQLAPARVRELAELVPPEVLTVGVVRGVSATEARDLAVESGVGALQLHGDYPASAFDAVRDLPVRLVRAVPIDAVRRPGDGPEPRADLLLVDSPVAGSGESWDWSSTDAELLGGRRWLLAGGLRPGNVGTAVRVLRPWGVDVSSGVERERGVKDHVLIEEFVRAARAAATG
ncbi:phosphoribosylanthranilate isomerase [Actinoalloteichus spitiensis]|uniref:phosphoribosylanthranilate isomerase n=1 Tax=Actinoalloteichus spitiensis TaxID=252394 RepID=UPI0003616895|nr:phosphoribosylanthranilate isomerase [Actinoalloteichus spitiensis]